MISETAQVAPSASIADTAYIWDLAQVRENAIIGSGVIVGRGVYVGESVKIGENSKVQNYALIYEPAEISSGVFIGPGTIFTNDRNPRAVNEDGSRKSSLDWTRVGVRVDTGASIGAMAVCVAPVDIGAWSMVAAGSVVTRDVPKFALVAGAPAKQVGWVGKAGVKLFSDPLEDSTFQCPVTGQRYLLQNDGELIEL
jgi:acetyltransferase-like isoleucine patch superfamily enzyme